MINCVIVDDEPLAREGMGSYVREVDFMQLVATCENPLELTKILDQHSVDLLFLDIQMPKMNGLDFLKMVQNPPMVIITTAYPTYALEGFQLNVLDYLLKPITFDRFFKSVTKAKDYYHLITRSTPSAPDPAEDYFFIRCGSKYEKIYFNQILYIEGMQNYITIYTQKGKYVTLLYLKNLEENLDNQSFSASTNPISSPSTRSKPSKAMRSLSRRIASLSAATTGNRSSSVSSQTNSGTK